jgi:RNA polymerase sigma-70 factor (ECF subfamily)
MSVTADAVTEDFVAARPHLFAVAYRMLGSVTDAEDVLQEAYLRWQSAHRPDVASAAAYLTTIVTRLCVDQLRSARVRRETYVGPWLPEPLLTSPAAEEPVELAESVSMAFLLLLEALSPLERAAFLLREVFGYSYAEVADLLDREPSAVRQLVSRARRHVADSRPRFIPEREEHERLTRSFVEACATGDLDALVAMLHEDAVLWSDGGGKVAAARKPVVGGAKVAMFLVNVARAAASASGGRRTGERLARPGAARGRPAGVGSDARDRGRPDHDRPQRRQPRQDGAPGDLRSCPPTGVRRAHRPPISTGVHFVTRHAACKWRVVSASARQSAKSPGVRSAKDCARPFRPQLAVHNVGSPPL